MCIAQPQLHYCRAGSSDVSFRQCAGCYTIGANNHNYNIEIPSTHIQRHQNLQRKNIKNINWRLFNFTRFCTAIFSILCFLQRCSFSDVCFVSQPPLEYTLLRPFKPSANANGAYTFRLFPFPLICLAFAFYRFPTGNRIIFYSKWRKQ